MNVNKQFPNQAFIIGGGVSIKDGIERGLWDKLKGKFVTGLNYSYNYYKNPTVQCFVDGTFYNQEIERMKHLPMIIGKKSPNIEVDIESNTILLKTSNQYYRDILKGCYSSSLCGLFSLSLVIYLLNIGEVYLLGFDLGDITNTDDNKPLTHFYQGEIEHRGIGKIKWYLNKKFTSRFDVFKDEKMVKIYNVSPNSKLEVFPKISYDKMFKRIIPANYDQDYIREEIKRRLHV